MASPKAVKAATRPHGSDLQIVESGKASSIHASKSFQQIQYLTTHFGLTPARAAATAELAFGSAVRS